MNRILFAGLLGGIAMFIWSYVAYTVLPLGQIGLRVLSNEPAVLDALQHGIPDQSGAYVFPGLSQASNPSDKKAGAGVKSGEREARYPSGLLIYNAAGSRPVQLSRWLFVDFLIELTQVVVAVFLLGQTRLTTFVARVNFLLLFGVVVGIATNLSNWNWYGFPWDYTLASVFIQVVGFFCAGLVAALVLRKQTFGATSPRWLMQKLFWSDT